MYLISQKRILVLLAALLAVIFGIFANRNQTTNEEKIAYDKNIRAVYGQPIKVVEVVDGDTIVLANGDHLRYIGIDSPEEYDQRKPVQCYSKEAQQKNTELVLNKNIKFYKDKTEKDAYGRWLGFVYLEDGIFVNLEMVKGGYAFAYAYAPDTSRNEQFAAAEADARTNKVGLWGACIVTTMKGGREQTNPLQ